uniref:Ovule protein n=1 Tax=Haemonchus placei TaxID=6290 RepID=A0A0N4VV52_HAEPC
LATVIGGFQRCYPVLLLYNFLKNPQWYFDRSYPHRLLYNSLENYRWLLQLLLSSTPPPTTP